MCNRHFPGNDGNTSEVKRNDYTKFYFNFSSRANGSQRIIALFGNDLQGFVVTNASGCHINKKYQQLDPILEAFLPNFIAFEAVCFYKEFL